MNVSLDRDALARSQHRVVEKLALSGIRKSFSTVKSIQPFGAKSMSYKFLWN